MDYPYHNRDMYGSRPPVHRTNRSWTDDGLDHNVRTTSYASPGLIFEMNSTSATGARPQRREGPGIFGAAVNLIGNVMAANHQQARQERRARQAYTEDMAYGEEDDEEGYDGRRDETNKRRRKPRSIIGAVAEKLIGGQQQHSRKARREREQSPTRQDSGRGRGGARPRRYRDDERRHSYASGSQQACVDDFSDDTDDEESDDEDEYDMPHDRRPRRAFTVDDASMIQSLENAAEHHRREMRRCQKQLEAASRQPTVSSRVLQNLVNELRGHEQAHLNAVDNLRMAKAGSGRQAQHQSRGSRHQQQSSRSGYYQTLGDDDLGGFFQPRRRATSYVGMNDNGQFGPFAGDPFTAFNHMFHNFGFGIGNSFHHPNPSLNAFFGVPQATFTFIDGNPNARPHASPQPGAQFQNPTASAPRPSNPPPNLLKPDEAKRLFKTYNERWNTLLPTDPNIPYPTRTFAPSALSASNTLWAPTVDAPIATWSDELVMQANAQALFLGVVDLSPVYSDSGPTGRITMGFDRARANAAQVARLVEVLKKEKGRWHSDRLGRRSGRVGGVNEELAGDGRARAVFHGVCELMDFANGG